VAATICDPGCTQVLRLNLTSEHLDRTGPANDLLDPATAFTTFSDCATHLQRWYDGGCQGRPATHRGVRRRACTTVDRGSARPAV